MRRKRLTATLLALSLLISALVPSHRPARAASPPPDTRLGNFEEAPYRHLVTIRSDLYRRVVEIPRAYIFSPELLDRTVIIGGRPWRDMVIVYREAGRYYLRDLFEETYWATPFINDVHTNWDPQVPQADQERMTQEAYRGTLRSQIDPGGFWTYPDDEEIVSINGRPWQETEWRDEIVEGIPKSLMPGDPLRKEPLLWEIFLNPAHNGWAREVWASRSGRPDTRLGNYEEALYRPLVTLGSDGSGRRTVEIPWEHVYSFWFNRLVLIGSRIWTDLIIVSRRPDPAGAADRYYVHDLLEEQQGGVPAFLAALRQAGWDQELPFAERERKEREIEQAYETAVREEILARVRELASYPHVEPIVSINGRPWQETGWRDFIIDQVRKQLKPTDPLLADPRLWEIFLDPLYNGLAKEALAARDVAPAPPGQISDTGAIPDQVVITPGTARVVRYVGGAPQVVPLMAPAEVVDGVAMVPLRGVFDLLGADVSYDGSGMVHIWGSGHSVAFQVGRPTLWANGQEVLLDRPAEIRNGRVLIPLRPVARHLGYQVTWDPRTGQTTVWKPEEAAAPGAAGMAEGTNAEPLPVADWRYPRGDLGNRAAAAASPGIDLLPRWVSEGGVADPSLILDQGVLYATSHTTPGRLVALDVATGQRRWEREFVSAVTLASAGHGNLYITDYHHTLYAFAPDGTLRWEAGLPGIVSPPVVTADAILVADAMDQLHALDPHTGEVRWTVPFGGDPSAYLKHGMPAVAAGRLFIPSRGGWLQAHDIQTGKHLYTLQVASTISPVADNGLLYVANGSSLHAYDPESGEQRWEYEAADGITAMAASRGRLVLADHDANLSAVDARTGERLWQRSLDGFSTALVIAGDQVYVGLFDGGLQVFDLTTGELVTTLLPDEPVRETPIPSGQMLFVPTAGGRIYALGSTSVTFSRPGR